MSNRVYFAFHYQDVKDFRANVVRKHNVVDGPEQAGYFDASIWEESKKKGNLALKRLINKELEYTTVTAVLIGSDTYARPWVRYEIFKSIERGNTVLGIHINSIEDKKKQTKPSGPNPFKYLTLAINDDGTKASPFEWDGTRWVTYTRLDPFPVKNGPAASKGKQFQLSQIYPTYDWIADSGYDNFQSWIS